MSETVMEKGKLVLVARLDDETLEEQCKRILNSEIDGYDLGWYQTHKEALMSELYDDYYVYKDTLYKLGCYSKLGFYEDIVIGERKEDESIDFLVSYYNGGACLHEMLDMVMGKINKKVEVPCEEDKQIISTCLLCGSNSISIQEDIDYDYEEEPYVSGYYLECNNCGNTTER